MPKIKYRCDECMEVHDWEDDAQECCQPTVTEVYVCPECDDTHREEADAVECCAVADADDSMPMASARELEEAGQQRLPL